jgi:hypothetical protein
MTPSEIAALVFGVTGLLSSLLQKAGQEGYRRGIEKYFQDAVTKLNGMPTRMALAERELHDHGNRFTRHKLEATQQMERLEDEIKELRQEIRELRNRK